MWTHCITSISHVLKLNGYGGRQAKVNEKSLCFKGWETLVPYCNKVTRVRDKISMQTVLTALIFRHKQVVPQVYCQKSNRLLGQNIGS